MRKEKKYHYIYKTTNDLSGRYYYGLHSTDDLEDGYLGSGTYLRRAIRKHGEENFTKEIIEFCKSRNELALAESKVVTLKEVAKKECMNLYVGGALGFRGTHSEETKLKMRNFNLGKVLNKEHRKKISESLKNHIVTKETRSKISKINSNPSKEQRRKMSEGQINRFKTHSVWNKGKTNVYSDEILKKMSESAKNKLPVSVETRMKMSIAKKGIPKEKVKCPHCNKEGGLAIMKRWHFEKCKTKIS